MINSATKADAPSALDPDDLVSLFNRLFAESENTRLVRGDDEPIYLPADAHCAYHRVVFAHGFFSSALHEIAHWCIAGDSRRLLTDYGYWYAPDGRDRDQQREFERVEVKPQALEWILSRACRKPFRISVDNLNGEASDPEPFKRAVYRQVLRYCETTIPPRARKLHESLAAFYQTSPALDVTLFSPCEIGLTDSGELNR